MHQKNQPPRTKPTINILRGSIVFIIGVLLILISGFANSHGLNPNLLLKIPFVIIPFLATLGIVLCLVSILHIIPSIISLKISGNEISATTLWDIFLSIICLLIVIYSAIRGQLISSGDNARELNSSLNSLRVLLLYTSYLIALFYVFIKIFKNNQNSLIYYIYFSIVIFGFLHEGMHLYVLSFFTKI